MLHEAEDRAQQQGYAAHYGRGNTNSHGHDRQYHGGCRLQRKRRDLLLVTPAHLRREQKWCTQVATDAHKLSMERRPGRRQTVRLVLFGSAEVPEGEGQKQTFQTDAPRNH